jgi:hypothetical protein
MGLLTLQRCKFVRAAYAIYKGHSEKWPLYIYCSYGIALILIAVIYLVHNFVQTETADLLARRIGLE